MPRFNSREEYEQWKAGLTEQPQAPADRPEESDHKPVDEPSWQSMSDGYGRADGERPIHRRRAYNDERDAKEREVALRKLNRKIGVTGIIVGLLIVSIASWSVLSNLAAGFIYPWPAMVGWTGIPAFFNGLGLLITGHDPHNRGIGLPGRFNKPFYLFLVLAYLIGDGIVMCFIR